MTDTTIRNGDPGQTLRARRRAIQDDIQSRVRTGRVDRPTEVHDDIDRSDASSEGDMQFALLQMNTATLTRIDEALGRIGAGKYGCCVECEGVISDVRLRAMPFAVRCQACEGRREQEGHARRIVERRGAVSPFQDPAGP